MKNLLYSASIEDGSSEIVSNTNSDWSKIPAGSLIRFKDDPIFYHILKVDKVFIFKNFEVLDSRRIKIDSHTGFSIAKHDELHLSWDEYELSTVSGINNAGKGYKVGDIIECREGSALETLSDQKINYCSFRVSEVGSSGEISQISLEERGTYFVKPPKSACIMSGGSGSGAIFDLIFFNKEQKGFAAKSVSVINSFENQTIMLLDSGIPKGLKIGSTTLNKWKITLDRPYCGEERVNSPYELYFEFTPHCKLPMPSQHSLGLDMLLKNTQLILDKKIQEIDHRLAALELANSKQSTGS